MIRFYDSEQDSSINSEVNEFLKEKNSFDHVGHQKRLGVGKENSGVSEYKEHFQLDPEIVDKLQEGEVRYDKVKNPLTEITAAYFRYKKVLNQIGSRPENSKSTRKKNPFGKNK